MGFEWRPEFVGKSKTYLSHLIVYFPDSSGGNKGAMIVSQIAFVRFPITLFSESNRLFDERIMRNGLSDIIDLTAFVMTIRIWQEENLIKRQQLRSYIDKEAIWTLPNAMELCFDEDHRPMPDGPSKLLFSTMRSDMLWNNRETFVDWFIRQGIYRDIYAFAPKANVLAK
jgi:hypothetical protein